MMPSRLPIRHSEWRRRLVPAMSVGACSMAMTVPLPMLWPVMPNLALLLTLIWASVQPRLMPVWAAFLLGLLHDVVVAAPLGLHGLLFALGVVAVRVADGRLEVRSHGMDWLMVGMLVVLLHALMWLVLPIAGVAAPVLPILLQALFTLACFPPMLALAAMLHRRLVEQGA